MPTKLSRFCDGVIEAAWLAAVVLIPIFFNIYSSRIFEPDKITILRSLALLTLGAWVVKVIEEGGLRWRERKPDEPILKYLWGIPLIAPVMALVIVYLVSTIFSVTPRVSLWGSYQRLQGTYTTFSYLVIFAALVTHIRSKSQIERLVMTIILTSLPISLYGVLQKYQIDPVPWGGNVSIRIASNMGNSIFVAAYLIMVFPLTVGRIVKSFRMILKDEGPLAINIAQASIYVFIMALQVIAIYMSGSRGPALGLFAGAYFMALLLSLYWNKRWLSITIVCLAVVGGAFLLVFNLDQGPLEELRQSPAIGRFGLLLDAESNSALVRQYIWEGTVELVKIHTPLKFPDGGNDKLNFLRPLVGYGPEGMYVAYNQFYPPELGHVEKRNASPDRAHNETWDSVIITGLAGLAVYLFVFGSLFYYGLNWLGLIHDSRQKYAFLGLFIGGGVAGTIGLILWRGIEFVGVGLPIGMIIGVIAYLTLHALFSSFAQETTEKSNPWALLIIVLLGAFVAHFVEINFGIAIVATRTLFWTYAGLMLVVGYILPKYQETEETGKLELAQGDSNATPSKAKKATIAKRRKIERSKSPLFGSQPEWVRSALLGVISVSLIIATMGYNFVTNPDGEKSLFSILADAMTRLPNKGDALSYGVLAMVITTWLACVLLVTAENAHSQDHKTWWRIFGTTLGISGVCILIFWFWHAASLAALAQSPTENQYDVLDKINSIGGLLTNFYFYMFVIFCLAAFILPEQWPARSTSSNAGGVLVSMVALPLVMVLVVYTNLRVIHADIAFKMAEPFSQSSQWQMATLLYQRALELAPMEDHYYLFLGRSYLEQAKMVESEQEQTDLILQAETDLLDAQRINPLNTDHTANLARLYSWWAGRATDATIRAERAQIASNYYAVAVTLSPNNSTIWGEWAILLLQVMRNPSGAFERISHALELDSEYSFTQGLMGDYYLFIAHTSTDAQARADALLQAISHYGEAARVYKSRDQTSKAAFLVSMGNAYLELASLNPDYLDRDMVIQAIDTMIQAINSGLRAADVWKVQEAIAKLFIQLGDIDNALTYANQALLNAPEASIERIQTLIGQIQAIP